MRLASSKRGSRALLPGSRAGRLIVAVLTLAVVAGGAWFWAASQADHHAKPVSSSSYGGLPSWLPKATVKVGRVVHASAAHPQLGIEGDTFWVQVGQSKVMATAVGPQVPEEGQFPVPATSPCSFDVTFTRATGDIALYGQAFTVLDELGQLHYLRITAQGGGRMPAEIRPGQTMTLIMSAVLPTGNGTLRWSPRSARPIVSWDFDVEID
jgi:hypothetical protein